MATNGHNGANGRGEFSPGKLWGEISGMFAAEVISSAVGLAIVGYIGQVIPGPMNWATKAVSKVAIEPYLDQWEWVISHACRMKECQPDMSKSREQRAEQVAHTLVLLGAATGPSILTKILVRRGINAATNPNKYQHTWWNLRGMDVDDLKVLAWDEIPHIGSMVVLNTLTPQVGDKLIPTVTSIMQKLMGWDEKRARDFANMVVVWELPNAVGFTSAVGKIFHRHWTEGSNGHSI